MSLRQSPSKETQAETTQRRTAGVYPHRAAYTKGVLFCVAATVLMGVMFPVMTKALTHIDPFTFTSLRYLIAGTAFFVLLLAREGRGAFRLKGEPILRAWLLGSIGFCGFGSFVF